MPAVFKAKQRRPAFSEEVTNNLKVIAERGERDDFVTSTFINTTIAKALLELRAALTPRRQVRVK